MILIIHLSSIAKNSITQMSEEMFLVRNNEAPSRPLSLFPILASNSAAPSPMRERPTTTLRGHTTSRATLKGAEAVFLDTVGSWTAHLGGVESG